MKRVLLIFALFGAFALAANAQQKACCAGKKAAAKTESCTSVDQATLEKAASADASIVKQVSDNGEVSYARKVVDEKTGQVNYTSVEYCTKSKNSSTHHPPQVRKFPAPKTAKQKLPRFLPKNQPKLAAAVKRKKPAAQVAKRQKFPKPPLLPRQS